MGSAVKPTRANHMDDEVAQIQQQEPNATKTYQADILSESAVGNKMDLTRTMGGDASFNGGHEKAPDVNHLAESKPERRRRPQRSVRPQNAESVSPPVSAVYPLPPAALADIANKSSLPTASSTSALVDPILAVGGTIQNSRGGKERMPGPALDQGGSPPEGSHIYRTEIEDPKTDAEGKSLAELKMSFTVRMNEAIRMQRERMRLLLSDVDSKIVSLKKEHGLRPVEDGIHEQSPDLNSIYDKQVQEYETKTSEPAHHEKPFNSTPAIDTDDDKENDNR